MIGPRPGIKDEQAGVSLQWFKEPYHEQSQGWIGAVSSDYIVLPVDDYHLSSQCLSQQMFVTTKLLSRRIFVSANIILSWQSHHKHVCHDKTCLLLWQKYACRNKTFVVTKILVAAFANDRWQAHSCVEYYSWLDLGLESRMSKLASVYSDLAVNSRMWLGAVFAGGWQTHSCAGY